MLPSLWTVLIASAISTENVTVLTILTTLQQYYYSNQFQHLKNFDSTYNISWEFEQFLLQVLQ
jgi:hypothetical protein